ncbi:MAG: hypothetical protein DRN81_05230 [Thermoproteota archaeon]|nr:MAG: hypothetical protein DRN81_05230 [Candidatus Korarchaeota archaeon]
MIDVRKRYKGTSFNIILVLVGLTNPSIDRKEPLSAREIMEMFRKADEIENEYFRLRAKALLSLFRSGKRRAEVASLRVDDLKIEGRYLYVTFTVVKKRKKSTFTKTRTKRFPLEGKLAQNIIEYWEYVKTHMPEAKYLFPSIRSVFGYSFAFYKNKHLSGRQILRIIKSLNPNAWCHLFRETRGAEIVKKDEAKGQVSIFTVYKVKHALDLEQETTAWNYIRRYASEVIDDEIPELDQIRE